MKGGKDFMGIILFIIFIICSILIFKNKDKRFPNNPILGWIVCSVIVAVALYGMYYFGEQAADNAAFNAGYQDAFK